MGVSRVFNVWLPRQNGFQARSAARHRFEPRHLGIQRVEGGHFGVSWNQRFFWLEKNNRVTKKVKLGWCVFFCWGWGGLGWWFWLVPSEASKNGFQKANFHLSRGNSQLPKKKGQQTEHYRNSGDLWPTLSRLRWIFARVCHLENERPSQESHLISQYS